MYSFGTYICEIDTACCSSISLPACGRSRPAVRARLEGASERALHRPAILDSRFLSMLTNFASAQSREHRATRIAVGGAPWRGRCSRDTAPRTAPATAPLGAGAGTTPASRSGSPSWARISATPTGPPLSHRARAPAQTSARAAPGRLPPTTPRKDRQRGHGRGRSRRARPEQRVLPNIGRLDIVGSPNKLAAAQDLRR